MSCRRTECDGGCSDGADACFARASLLSNFAVSKATGRGEHYLVCSLVAWLDVILMPAWRAGISKAEKRWRVQNSHRCCSGTAAAWSLLTVSEGFLFVFFFSPSLDSGLHSVKTVSRALAARCRESDARGRAALTDVPGCCRVECRRAEAQVHTADGCEGNLPLPCSLSNGGK
jgi:hypothetical protein